jgi:hypothetical protein
MFVAVVAVVAFPERGPTNDVAVRLPPASQLGPPVERSDGVTDPALMVTGMLIFADPLKLVAVPVTSPDKAIVLPVASVVAVPALPEQDEEVAAFPPIFVDHVGTDVPLLVRT